MTTLSTREMRAALPAANRVAQAAESSPYKAASAELDARGRSNRRLRSLGAAITITLAIVFVMVVKPTLY
jgi:hypothetical protein